MLVTVRSRDSLCTRALPGSIGGAHWLCDARGTRLAFVEGAGGAPGTAGARRGAENAGTGGANGAWSLTPADGFRVKGSGAGVATPISLSPDALSTINLEDRGGSTWSIVSYPEDPRMLATETYGFEGDADLTVGRKEDNVIRFDCPYVSGHHLRLSSRNGAWAVTDLRSANGVFINGRKINPDAPVRLAFGDTVSAFGLNITVGSGLFSLNNPAGLVSVRAGRFVKYEAPTVSDCGAGTAPPRPFFYPSLRFARSVEKAQFTIDAPPAREKAKETPLIARVGPSLGMVLASLLSACMFFTVARILPMLIMAAAMLAGSVVWPIVQSRQDKKEREENEARRRGRYAQYLSEVTSAIARTEEAQRAIITENRIPVSECLRRASVSDRRLMDRTALHADYLDVRLGVGNVPFEADIRFPEQHFSMDDDDLRADVDRLAREPRILRNVPIALPLVSRRNVGIIGAPGDTLRFLRGMIVQVAALCSYGNVKIVVFCDRGQYKNLAFARHLPHCFSNDFKLRYFACGLDEANTMGMLLERIIVQRLEAAGGSGGRFDAREASPYYIVVCASEAIAAKAGIIETVSNVKQNPGISLITVAREMKDLPKACASVISVSGTSGYLLNRDVASGNRMPFAPDIYVSRVDAERFARNMNKARLDLETEDKQIPSSLGFLEMFGAGAVEHLGIAARWRESNAAVSLAARVGVDAQGEPFLLNLHEKYHGPHGLIAGTTGSGKSEFIITYILSMALTYSPEEVSFVLIDYKGGGLAKAFDNERVRLPHLSGVITNLDGAAITRSLASIQSELKRRQALFNRAREVVGGDNVDIYGYLDLFRQGRMSDPCPHLFIVADEFAELKQQEPEFMDELISAARIGRSLGVHLILATQKPTGVVNDQIWSNARFKVCLKVADAADSNEMIKRPDAAELKQAGRFYLLVGYNEYFAMGQSGYAGTRYERRDRTASRKEDTVVLVSNDGSPVVSVRREMAVEMGEKRPESVVVLEAIQQTAAIEGVRARQLWLEPVPAMILVDELRSKYAAGEAAGAGAAGADVGGAAGAGGVADVGGGFALNPLIGEYDDPKRQRQGALTIPLSAAGNALVYGTPDSGTETVLYAMLYSLMQDFDSSQLNVYALDFGTESLRAFQGAPFVGDVIGAADDEKVRRFFAFIDAEFGERRALMAPYGGSFTRYVQNGGKKPAIVIILNDVAAFMEAYPKLEDNLAKLVREAGRSGVYLVMTAAGTTSVRVKMRQSFRFLLACDLPDVGEYGMIFGSMRGVPIPRGFARGLVALEDGIFEFQAAHLDEGGDDYACASKAADAAAHAAQTLGIPAARPIPVAPARVTREMLAREAYTRDFIPFGYYDDTLQVAGFGFEDAPVARCQFQRRKDGAAFGKAFVQAVTAQGQWDVALLDLAQLFGGTQAAGCVFATGEDDPARRFWEELVGGATVRAAVDAAMAGERPEAADSGAAPDGDASVAGTATPARSALLVVTGIMDFLNRAGYDFAGKVKGYLKTLRAGRGICVLLMDSVSETSFVYEDWFKAHMSSKDGLWIGAGVESQNAISISFNRGLEPDSRMHAGKGYESIGGTVRLVHVIGSAGDAAADASGLEVLRG